MRTVRVCSLGQITKALFEVGGEYRRSMQSLQAAPPSGLDLGERSAHNDDWDLSFVQNFVGNRTQHRRAKGS